ncbi:MAG: glycosyltransferase [Bacteroidia bacterium]
MVLKLRNSSNGIGDQVCGLYACQALKNRYPEATIEYYSKTPEWLTDASDIIIKPYSHYFISPPAQIDLYVDSSGSTYRRNAFKSRKEIYTERIGLKDLKPSPPVLTRKKVEGGKHIILVPFAAWSDREWPIEKWIELEQLLINSGHSVLIIGQGSRHDELFKFQSTKLIDYASEDIITAMLDSFCVVANDSGMAHVAGMYNVPCVSVISNHFGREHLFSHTNVEAVLSGSEKNISQNNLRYRGGRPTDLNNIQVDKVYHFIAHQVNRKKTIVHLVPYGFFIGGGERLIHNWDKYISEHINTYFIFQDHHSNKELYEFKHLKLIRFKEETEINGILRFLQPSAVIDHGSLWRPEIISQLYKGVNANKFFFIHGCELFKLSWPYLDTLKIGISGLISNYYDKNLEQWGVTNLCITPIQIDIDRFPFIKRSYQNKIRVGIVGRLAEEKISKNFLEELLRFDDKRFLFSIYGAGWEYKDYVLDRIKRVEHIRYCGYKSPEDVIDIYNEIDIILCASASESGGYAILEAMATGCPVVSRNTGALPETVGDGGIIVDDDDKLLLNALSKFTKQNLPEWSVKARRKVENHNGNLHKQYQTYNEFINKVISESSTGYKANNIYSSNESVAV